MRIEKKENLISNLEDWFKYAAPQKAEAHWVDGRSAKECAKAWLGDNEFPQIPAEIGRLLDSNNHLTGWSFDLVTPEHKVKFDSWGEHRHTDMAAWGNCSQGKLCLHVEAKADEGFDRKVIDVLNTAIGKIADEENTNAIRRVEGLAASILPPLTPNAIKLGELRYQLLTAVAGLLADAEKSGATHAVFVVHEFVTDKTSDHKHNRNKKDLDDFVARLSGGSVISVVPEKLYGPFIVSGQPLFSKAVPLYIGKAIRTLRKTGP